MLEKEIEDHIKDYVAGLGGHCLKLRIDGQNGYPDRTVMLPNTPSFTIEFKTPKGKPSDKQLFWHDTLWALGQKNFIVDNAEDAEAIVDVGGLVYKLPICIYRRTVDQYISLAN